MIKPLLAKFNDKHFLSLAGNGITAFFGIVIFALLSRVLNEADFGNWIFFQTAFMLIDTFRNGFLQTAVAKFYVGVSKARAEEVAGSAWYIAIIITLIFIGINLISLFFYNQITDSGLQFFIKFFGICFLAMLPSTVANWILSAELAFLQLLYMKLINQILFMLSILVLKFYEAVSLITVTYVYISILVIVSFSSLMVNWAKFGLIKQRTKNCVSELINFGKYSVGTVLSSTLLKSSDTFIVKFMLGPAALAIYNIPQKLMEIIEFLLRSFVAVAIPKMSAAINQNNESEFHLITKKYIGFLTILLVPISLFCIIFADHLILIIAGLQYADTESANILRIFMLTALIFPADRFTGISLDVLHKPEQNLYKVIITLIVNIAGDIIGIYLLKNVYGAALSSFVTLIIGFAYGYWALKKFSSFNFKNTFNLGFAELKNAFTKIRYKS